MVGVISAGFRGEQGAPQCTRPQARLSAMIASTCKVDIMSISLVSRRQRAEKGL